MNISRVQVLLAVLAFSAGLTGALGEVALSPVWTSGSQLVSTFNAPAAGPNRPGQVPDGYVITPFGYFHPSCVQSLAKGERLLPDGRLQHANGAIEGSVAVCSYPHYTHDGVPINAGSANTSNSKETQPEAKTAPEINGWIENANVITGSAKKSYGALIATWTVPAQPSANDGQVLYFFPGFEDINDVQSILQPVLGWYQQQWSIASWNCCLNGVTTNSPGVVVTSGDQIYGSITSSCPPGTLSCKTWNVLSLDLSTGESTTLSNTPSRGQAFNWAFGGVMEPYYVISCDDYPSDGELSFDKIRIFDQDLHPVFNPKWSGTFNSVATPQCGYGVSFTSRRVTLSY